MSVGPIIDIAPELDLRVEGAVGSFSVSPAAPGVPSLPVKYIQTHITFDLDGGHKERLFQNLRPVREVFQTRDLGFEDLMQRDIDDGRVSTELIKYLLEPGAVVKFFPPIVAVLVPVGPQNRLLAGYPEVTYERTKEATFERCVQRFGPLGRESFEFEQLEVAGVPRAFDNARLRVNTNRCKIVIVDGQHRAMALLALYRNLKGWPDNTLAFRHYYARWTPEQINAIDLSDISLPIAICAFPTLVGDSPPLRVTEACRAVFLALNKNAKPVTRARNILLNDRDLIPYFERAVLEDIKSYEADSPDRLRLWNFELDAEKDRSVLTSAVALSGVMHLHQLLERALLLTQKPTGLYIHGSNFWLKKNIDDTVLRRLDGQNLLGSELASSTTRVSFTPEALVTLQKSFKARYLRLIVDGFKRFGPYTAMAAAASDVEVALRPHTDKRPHSMLFEGQGVLKVFRNYLDQITEEAQEQKELKRSQTASELEAIIEELRALQSTVNDYEVNFRRRRAEKLLVNTAQGKILVLTPLVDRLYKEAFTTAAFQIAFFCTFFFMMEDLNGDGGELRLEGSEQESEFFEEYIRCLNGFFAPDGESAAKNIFSVFLGSVSGTFGSPNMTVAPSAVNLRSIVIPGELKPDEWPKLRYFMLELWRPQDGRLSAKLETYRAESRTDVLAAFYRQKVKMYCKERGMEEHQVSDKAREALKRDSCSQYQNALATLVGPLSEQEKLDLKRVLEEPAPPSEEEISPAAGQEEDFSAD